MSKNKIIILFSSKLIIPPIHGVNHSCFSNMALFFKTGCIVKVPSMLVALNGFKKGHVCNAIPRGIMPTTDMLL